MQEVSVATEQVVGGQTGVLVAGLRAAGSWCFQPRSNALTAQIRCQGQQGDATVDLVSDLDGDLTHAEIQMPTEVTATGVTTVTSRASGALTASGASGTSTTEPVRAAQDHLRFVLEASLLTVWPQDRGVLDGLLRKAEPRSFLPFGDAGAPHSDEEQYQTLEQRSERASWSLRTSCTGAPLALTVRTDALRDRSWPFGASHYAGTTAAAAARLQQAGSSCGSSGCSLGDEHGDRSVAFGVHDGQIVTADLTLRPAADGAAATTEVHELEQTLAFLTPEVRTDIAAVIARSQAEGSEWRGLVAGTPVQVSVENGWPTLGGRHVYGVRVLIGIPLLYVGP
ncbi:hypothetical protein MN205_04655 [Kineococcus sp. TRM81007]|uniref:hypothetical protein n=1 Tax=Kineococcus sp. TRM81007 TaxID=2925831 RepID=UPI001F5A547A|nr:hypothetical protein [Kineococcus sp. TRM81007]MCI2237778.1 hypothetical protein [Kineococcus sp. TRM81007]